MIDVFNWIEKEFPMLDAAIKWNQPMFIHEGTFIIGFSMAMHHMSFTPEEALVTLFLDDIKKSGYDHTKGLVKVKWNQEVDLKLLRRMIEFNIEDKAGYKNFFRK
nr:MULTISPECIES: DUF1801 domain-containing protein [unclassified Fusibacter]